jgi:hypothetical protein
MTDFELKYSIHHSWETIKIGKYSLPDWTMFCEIINAPTLDLFLIERFMKNYRMTPSIRKDIEEIVNRWKPDTLWADIMKVVGKNLDNQDCKLMYIFFSLQKYRLPQTSIDFDSMEHLAAWNNSKITEIKAEFEDRIQNSSEADKILKTFHKRIGVEWEEHLYNDLAIKYLLLMLPSPVGMMNNIDNDYTLNLIGRSKLKSEIQKNIYEREIKNIEDQMNEPNNEMRKMKLTYQIEDITEKIPPLELDMSLDPDLEKYSSRAMETHRRLCIIFSEAYFLLDNDYRLSLALHTECPEYFTALAEKIREKINQRNLNRAGEYSKLCQCQFCYKYRFEKRSGNGEYAWHCGGDCKRRYDSWTRHLNRLKPLPIELSSVFG